MSDHILDSVTFDSSPHSGATTATFQADVLEGVDAPREEDVLQVARGYEVRQGYGLSFSGRILEWQAFLDLVAIMEEDSDLDVTLTWVSGLTTVLSQGRLTATPVLDEVPDRINIWYDTDTTIEDNPDSTAKATPTWTELGKTLGTDGNDADVLTTEDGRGLALYTAGRFLHAIPIDWDSTAFSNLDVEEQARNEVRIAIQDQSGNWRIYGNGANNEGVRLDVREMVAPGPEERERLVPRIYFTGSFLDFIRFEDASGNSVTPEDFHHGVEFEVQFFGQTRGDVITENR